ncbi:MAG: DUF1501 domain-containing protein [Bdellovibrionales bacterium]|nr:DUF1501 domain-containing protein [Bdellovibrionales bacterium]
MKTRCNISRRQFLRSALAGSSAVAAQAIATPSSSLSAWAMPEMSAASQNGNVAIFMNMSGGASVNISPCYDDYYMEAFGAAAYTPEQSIPVSPYQGIHPSLGALQEAWNDGDLAILNMVGYRGSPNGSHEASTRIVQTALRDMSQGSSGWAARNLCQYDNIFGGISFSGSMQFMDGACGKGFNLGSLSGAGRKELPSQNGYQNTPWQAQMYQQLIAANRAPQNDAESYVGSSINRLETALASLSELGDITIDNFPTNTGFARSCYDVARVLSKKDELPVPIMSLQQGGFDTHSNERQNLANALSQMNGGIGALIREAKARNIWNRVCFITITEFGRTAHVNGSNGTDHGHCFVSYVFGGAVRGGIYGARPGAEEMIPGNYFKRKNFEIEQIYNEVAQWIGLTPENFEGAMQGNIGFLV